MPAAETRTERLELRTSATERGLIEQAADEAGLTISSWLRTVAITEARTNSAVRNLRGLLPIDDPASESTQALLPARTMGVERANGRRHLGLQLQEVSNGTNEAH